jgi:hypothetical protein
MNLQNGYRISPPFRNRKQPKKPMSEALQTTYRALLRARRERPRRCGAAERPVPGPTQPARMTIELAALHVKHGALPTSRVRWVSLAGGCQPGTAVSLGRNVCPQKHDQEDQDRIHHDPHDVGSPTPSLLYSLLAHGGFSLGSQCMGPPCHRTDGQVLGANLKCSESRCWAAVRGAREARFVDAPTRRSYDRS